MKIEFSPDFQKELFRLKKKDPDLTSKIVKQLKIFIQNPRHPFLRTHKLSGNLDNFWSISITKSIRMIYQLNQSGSAYFIDLGTHDEVYGK